MNEALLDWLLGLGFSFILWLLSFLGQRVSKSAPSAVKIPRWLAWISGYPNTPTVNPSNFGWQFFAVALLCVNTYLVLTIPEHSDRIAQLTLAWMVLMVVTVIVVEWLRRRRVRG